MLLILHNQYHFLHNRASEPSRLNALLLGAHGPTNPILYISYKPVVHTVQTIERTIVQTIKRTIVRTVVRTSVRTISRAICDVTNVRSYTTRDNSKPKQILHIVVTLKINT